MTPLILVVDDNPANLKLATVVLRSEGFEVTAAASAKQALEVITLRRPTLILTDLQMPEMDGFELTRLLKTNPELRDIPVVALTAYAMKGDEQRARAAGCSGYVSKPIDTRTLGDTVRAMIHAPEASHP